MHSIKLRGFGKFDDYKVLRWRFTPERISECIILPYPLDPAFNLQSDGVCITSLHTAVPPKEGSKVYMADQNCPSNIFFKNKYSICDSPEDADILVDNSRVGYKTFRAVIRAYLDSNLIIISAPDNDAPYMSTKIIYSGVIAVIYNLSAFAKVEQFKPLNKPTFSTLQLLKYSESPEFDLNLDICKNILEMVTSTDVDTVYTGVNILFSSNFLKYEETTKAFLNMARKWFIYASENGDMVKHFNWLSEVIGRGRFYGFSHHNMISHEDWELFNYIYPTYNKYDNILPFINKDGTINYK